MATFMEIHREHKEWQADLEFLLQELKFLSKLIHGYQKVADSKHQADLLDAYKDQFSNEIEEVNEFLNYISQDEKKIKKLINEDLFDVDSEYFETRKDNHERLRKLFLSERNLKESFYDFIHEFDSIPVGG